MADESKGSSKIRVRLVTPERILVETDVDAVELPAKTGYMEVLYGHAPLLAELGAGDVTLHGKGGGEDAGKGFRCWRCQRVWHDATLSVLLKA